MSSYFLGPITVSDARSLSVLFNWLPSLLTERLQLLHDEEVKLCTDLWNYTDSSLHYLLYLSLDLSTHLIIERHYCTLLPSDETNKEPWSNNPFWITLYAAFSSEDITLQSVDLVATLQLTEQNFIMKKNNCLQKIIAEEINKFCELWHSTHDEGGDSFTEWKLYAPDNEVIRAIHEHIWQSQFTSSGFTERCYKEFFLWCIHLADNAVRILVEADIMNSICNINWMLDFNINGEVHEGPSARWAHLRQPSLNDHSKLQVFLNCFLHGEHDSHDSDILPATALFKLTAAAEPFTEESTSSQATSAKSTKKLTITLNLTTTLSLSTTLNLVTSFKKLLLQLLIDITSIMNKTLTKKTTVRPLSTEFTSSLSLLSSVLNSEPNIAEEENGKEGELAQMSGKDDTVDAELITKLEECIWQLKSQNKELAQHSDEKITFLTAAGACLNEVILLQAQDVVKADTFIKKLLDEPAIWVNKSLTQWITAWQNEYKQMIQTHTESRNEIWAAANRFPFTKARLFTHTESHQVKLRVWADEKDLHQVSEPNDQWTKYLDPSLTVDTVIHSVEKDPQQRKWLHHAW